MWEKNWWACFCISIFHLRLLKRIESIWCPTSRARRQNTFGWDVCEPFSTCLQQWEIDFAKRPAKRFKQLLMSTPGSTGRLPCSFQHEWLSICFVVKNDHSLNAKKPGIATLSNMHLSPTYHLFQYALQFQQSTQQIWVAWPPAYGTWQGFTLWPAAHKNTTLRAFLELLLWKGHLRFNQLGHSSAQPGQIVQRIPSRVCRKPRAFVNPKNICCTTCRYWVSHLTTQVDATGCSRQSAEHLVDESMQKVTERKRQQLAKSHHPRDVRCSPFTHWVVLPRVASQARQRT